MSGLSALSLEPLSHVFGTDPAARVRTFRVTNTQEQRIAVRVRMTTRDLLPDGSELRTDAEDDWLIFPRQLALEPGESQAVRVQYTGSGELDAERAFRIIAEQLPVDFAPGDGQSGINVLFRYEGSVYVRPANARPDIQLTDVSRRFEEGRFSGVAVRFENRGTAHAILNDLIVTLTLSDEDGNVLDLLIFNEDQLDVVGGSNVLAGRALEQVVAVPDGWQRGVVSANYDVDLVQ